MRNFIITNLNLYQKRMMKILFVLDYFTPSSWWVERLFEDIISKLDKDWHKIKVLSSKFNKNLPSYEKKWNLEIFRIGSWRFSFMILWCFLWLKLIKDVQIIHTSTYNAAYISKFLSFFTKSPVIITSHEILWKNWYKFKWWGWFFYKKFEDFIYKFWFFYVFVTNHVKNVAITNYKINLKKSAIINNWIDEIKVEWKVTRQDLWFEDNDIIWVFSWRPWRTKWLDFLLENVEEIRKLNPNFKLLLLLLEKNNKKKIKKILEKVNKNEWIKIIFELKHSEVYEYLSIADIWIVCSRTEWFWYSWVEFSKLSKKMILSNIWWIPEVCFWDCHFFKTWNKKEFISEFKKIFDGQKLNYSYDNSNSTEKTYIEYKNIYNFLIEK